MSIMPLVAAGAIGLGILSLFVGLYRLMKPAGALDERMEQLLQRRPAPAKAAKRAPFADLLKGTRLEKKLGDQFALELQQSDVALTVSEYVLFRLGASVLGLLLGTILMGNFLFGLVLAVLGLQLPVFYLHSRRGKRQHRFQSQLVDVLTMMVSGLRAGVGLIQAMELVRKEMPEPSSTEFGRVVREIGLGASLEEALAHLLERMPGDDLTMVITVINIQAEVGGNLANVLDGVVTTIRERVRIAQEIRTLTAQQRFSGYILALLPFGVGAAVMMLNPSYMQPLFSPQWIWLPGIAVVMIGIGFVVINKIVDIKV